MLSLQQTLDKVSEEYKDRMEKRLRTNVEHKLREAAEKIIQQELQYILDQYVPALSIRSTVTAQEAVGYQVDLKVTLEDRR